MDSGVEDYLLSGPGMLLPAVSYYVNDQNILNNLS